MAGRGTEAAFFSDDLKYVVGLNGIGEAVLKIREPEAPAFFLPTGTTIIEENAFEGDPLVTAVDAGSCAAIEANAFRGCTNLTEIVLPQNCLIDPAAVDHPVCVFAPPGGTTQQSCEGQENLVFIPMD